MNYEKMRDDLKEACNLITNTSESLEMQLIFIENSLSFDFQITKHWRKHEMKDEIFKGKNALTVLVNYFGNIITNYLVFDSTFNEVEIQEIDDLRKRLSDYRNKI